MYNFDLVFGAAVSVWSLASSFPYIPTYVRCARPKELFMHYGKMRSKLIPIASSSASNTCIHHPLAILVIIIRA